MKKNYINPQVTIQRIGLEQMIAESYLQRGEGSGGNNAEVKEMGSDWNFSDYEE